MLGSLTACASEMKQETPKETPKKTPEIKTRETPNIKKTSIPSHLSTIVSIHHQTAIKSFPYYNDSLYTIYCTPLKITDLQFQAGESITSVAAGDTINWEVSRTVSGASRQKQEHLLIKPISIGLKNNFVITTNRRTYHLNAQSSEKKYNPIIAWHYPQVIQLLKNNSEPKTEIIQRDAHYKIKLSAGNKPSWMPTKVYSDGSKTYIIFPTNIQNAPALFINNNQLVNYRIRGNQYIVDDLFQKAELSLGAPKKTTVTIERIE